jgi:hypothetical protein
MFEAPQLPGVDKVIAWFGNWPTFHDAEVISINLDRTSGCRVVVRASRLISDKAEDGNNLREYALVTFLLEGFPMDADGIVNTRIEFFNYQNVLSSLRINRIPGGYELVLDGIFGVDGTLMASRMVVDLEPA